jgi:TetR/AcrR family transcriptional repressor of nem operon
MAQKKTRINILKTGADIIHRKGFGHTGLREILKASGTPKGSFYHYFKDKEDFGMQVIDFYSGFILSWLNESMAETSLTPMRRLRGFFEQFRAYFEHNGFELGCPIGNLSLEMSGLSDNIREKLDSVFGRMRADIILCLKEAQKAGDLSETLDISETADFVVNSWEGAVLRMKVAKNASPLVNFEKSIFDRMLR